jgi:signal peptidase I
VLACAPALLPNVAAAQASHTIYVLPNGYFPKKTYAMPGDVITFVNRTNYWARILNDDYDTVVWYIQPGTSRSTTVNNGYGIELQKPDLWNVNNPNGRGGEIIHGSAPLSD